VTDACVREKSAFFILGPERRTVGYVAAIVAANRKVIRQVAEEEAGNIAGQKSSDESEVDESPHVLQVYVEPEFRRRGLATTALALLLRGHSTFAMEDPTIEVVKMVEGLGYTTAGSSDSPDGRPSVKFVHKIFADDK
jgi:GNAT superfamily N-acetyltransferase